MIFCPLVTRESLLRCSQPLTSPPFTALPRPSIRAAQFGHSCDGPAVPLVDYSAPPADRRAQRLKVVQVRGGREADSDSL